MPQLQGPVLPVAPLATSSSAALLSARELEAHQADERVVARLVRARLNLERTRGWMLLGGLIVTVAGVVGLCLTIQSRVALAVLGPLVASVPFVFGLAADRVTWLWFLRLARGHGLSESAARKIFDAAAGADHWIGVLTSCGRPPSDAEIAHFVISR